MLTKKEEQFCVELIICGNQTEAYQKSFENQNAGTCKANASRLLKKAEIQERLSELREIAKRLQAKRIDDQADDQGLIMGIKERLEILTQIARGEIPLSKPMVADGIIEMVPIVPDWMDRKNAISELNKMDGSYAPTKLATTDKDGNDKPAISIQVVSGLPDINEKE